MPLLIHKIKTWKRESTWLILWAPTPRIITSFDKKARNIRQFLVSENKASHEIESCYIHIRLNSTDIYRWQLMKGVLNETYQKKKPLIKIAKKKKRKKFDKKRGYTTRDIKESSSVV